MDSRCHLRFTTTNLSCRFPIFETSATALLGTTGTYRNNHLMGMQWNIYNLAMGQMNLGSIFRIDLSHPWSLVVQKTSICVAYLVIYSKAWIYLCIGHCTKKNQVHPNIGYGQFPEPFGDFRFGQILNHSMPFWYPNLTLTQILTRKHHGTYLGFHWGSQSSPTGPRLFLQRGCTTRSRLFGTTWPEFTPSGSECENVAWMCEI